MKHKSCIICIIPILLLCSCSSLFVKKSVFVPLMKDKGEAKIEASYGYEGININTAYAFSKHFSAMVNGFSAFNNGTTYKDRYDYQVEGGLGFFNSFQDSFMYEMFIGGSRGWLHSTYTRNSGELNNYYQLDIFNPVNPSSGFFWIPSGHDYPTTAYGDYFTVFMQHSFVLDQPVTSWNTFIWTLRAEYVKFDSYTETVSVNNQNLKYRVSVPYKIFLQPVFTDKIGLTHQLNFTVQAGLNFDVYETTDVFVWDQFFCYVGLEYTFHTNKSKTRNHRVLFKKKHKNLFQRGY